MIAKRVAPEDSRGTSAKTLHSCLLLPFIVLAVTSALIAAHLATTINTRIKRGLRGESTRVLRRDHNGGDGRSARDVLRSCLKYELHFCSLQETAVVKKGTIRA